jgi:large subunit ribosomal protein L10
VVKNRLAKLAAAEAGTEGIDDLLVGPTALTLIKGDAVIAAKTISTFARENDVLIFKGGLMDGAALAPDQFTAIAKLPGLDVLRGQLTGLAASPITGLARGLGAMLSGLAIALGQIAEQGLVSGEAPAEEPTAEPESEVPAEAEEAAAEEAPAEQASEPAPDEEQPESADGDAEVSDEESQPEEPAADDAEAEGSEE